MRSVLFRCDSSLSLGSGHLIRCRSLAQSFIEQGINVTFLCRRLPGHLIQRLQTDFTVLQLTGKHHNYFEAFNPQPLNNNKYSNNAQSMDAIESFRLLQQLGITSFDWIIVDHYYLDKIWEDLLLSLFKKHNMPIPRLLVIDDLANRCHSSDLLLDPNFYGVSTRASKRYHHLVPSECSLLLGPEYSILSSEYAHLHPLSPSRTHVKRLLVFFGGVDPFNCTSKALAVLLLREFLHLTIDVVIGPQNAHNSILRDMANGAPNIFIHSPLPSLADLMFKADLYLGAGGSSVWERACLLLPSLAVSSADNQLPILKALDHVGALKFLGNASEVTEQDMKTNLLHIIENFPSLDPASINVDGLGCSRILDKMFPENA